MVNAKSLTDKDIIKNYIKTKNNVYFSELYNRKFDKVMRFVTKMTKNKEVSEDISQTVFIKVLDKINNLYEEEGKFNGWLMTIAYNETVDYFRKEKKFIDSDMLGSPHSDFFEDLVGESNPELDLIDNETLTILYDAIETLPDEQKYVVESRLKDIKFKDICEMDGQNMNTALGRMRYARANLKNEMLKRL